MKYILYTLLAIIIFTSCEKEINWKTEEMPVMLVVDGTFTNEFKKHQVKLSLSADYFYNNPTPVVSGADVTISDGTNIIQFIENPVGSGIYETVDPVAGVAGKTYSLDINLNGPVNGATHYYALADLVKGIDIDSLSAYIYENPVFFEGSDMDSLITVVLVFGEEPGAIKNYYQLNLYDNNILINDTVDEVSVVDDKEGMNGEFVNSFFFFQQFNQGDTVQFELISVERKYYDFITGIKNLAGQSFDPFNMSGPPANAIGNIEGAEAIGFFKTAYVSKSSAVATYYIEE